MQPTFSEARRVRLPSLSITVFLLLSSGAAHASGRSDEAPEGLTPRDWCSIREAYEASRYAAYPEADGYCTRNPGQQWRAHFDGLGFTVQSDAGGWTWGLELERYGFAGSEVEVTSPSRVTAEGVRVAYQWDATLEEWYVNDPRGLEHGYTVHRRPTPHAEGPLMLALSVRGRLRPEVTDGGRGLCFVSDRGAATLSYTGLVVFDADGDELEASFEHVGDRLLLSIDEQGARYPLTIDPVAQQAYLKASNTDAEDSFGSAVAVSGDTVVVGARGESSDATGVDGDQDDDSAWDSGAAYVFVRSGTTWSQEAYLKASNTGLGDQFGWSVAISGDTVVIGAHGESSAAIGVNGDEDDDSAPSAGAAYVFVRDGTSWSQEAYLKASNTDTADNFGRSVAVSGDTVVIGAYVEDSDATGVNGDQGDDSASASGAAYVFVRSGTTWSQEAYLKASNTDPGDQFGWSVAISGDTVVVATREEASRATGVNGEQSDNSLRAAGAAYVFARAGTTWSQEAYLKASNTDAGDEFGWSVAVSGDTVIVGAPGESSSAIGVNGDQGDNSFDAAGAAYVFVHDGAGWLQEAYLKASNTWVQDGFGRAVAVSGDTAIVTAPSEDFGGLSSGAGYVFGRSGTSWTQEAYLKASNAEAFDFFGGSAALSGETVVVSAPDEASTATGVNGDGSNNFAVGAGAAYVFDLHAGELGVRYCTPAVPNSTGQPGVMAVTGSANVSDDDLTLAASDLPTGPNIGYFIMGTGMNTFTPPGSVGPICIAPGLKRYLPPVNNTIELPGGFSRVVGTQGNGHPVSANITPGSTWNFQAWHRDSMAGTSNLTDAVSVTFQ